MITGLAGGIMWALETVIIGIALTMTPFVSDEKALMLAPFVSTFLHDTVSAFLMWIFNGIRGKTGEVISVIRSKNFKWLAFASAIGGPVGMTGYVMAVSFMGASMGAVASAVYPAIGSVLAYVFLKEKVRWYQWIFLFITLAGVFGLSYSPELDIENFFMGIVGVFMCAFGWGIEGVILSKCLKEDIKSEYALQIRQTTSAVIYGVIIIPLLGGLSFTAGLFTKESISALGVVALAAFCATVSYLFYYKAIAKLGVSKAMALNITYTAWAILFTVVLLRDFSVLNTVTVVCAVTVVVCGIFAATDFKELFGRADKK